MNRFSPSLFLLVATVVVLDGLQAADLAVREKGADTPIQAPEEAWRAPGAWKVGDYWVGTGITDRTKVLSNADGRLLDREFAELDARARILAAAAREDDPRFAREFFELDGRVSQEVFAGSYSFGADGPLHVILIAPQNGVTYTSRFNPALARTIAQRCYRAGDWAEASRIFALLTANNVQDEDTMAWARASAARVNLEAGVRGETKLLNLGLLAEFHESQKEWEEALKLRHQVYLETEEPSREALEKLAQLADCTHRSQMARALNAEITRRWPKSTSDQ